jgi:formate dehydrogenase subunit gamma
MYQEYRPEQAALIIASHLNKPGALLPILHEIQETFGFIPSESVPQIAESLNLSRAEVHGVITFYHDFSQTPPARNRISFCRAEACQSVGGEELVAHAISRFSESRPGEFEIRPVYCLGLCAAAPAILINQDLHARVTPEKFDKLIFDIEAK